MKITKSKYEESIFNSRISSNLKKKKIFYPMKMIQILLFQIQKINHQNSYFLIFLQHQDQNQENIIQ